MHITAHGVVDRWASDVEGSSFRESGSPYVQTKEGRMGLETIFGTGMITTRLNKIITGDGSILFFPFLL